MLTYAGPTGHAFIGHRLYLPKRWTDDVARCREAGIPTQVGFATKLDLAQELLAKALAANVPFGWVTMDGGYGQYPQVRNWLAAHRLQYVVATSAALPLSQISVLPGAAAITRADGLLSRLADRDWQRRSCGEGKQQPHDSPCGPRLAEPGPARPQQRRRRPQPTRADRPGRPPRPTPQPALDRLAPQTQDPRPDQPLPTPRRPATHSPTKMGKPPSAHLALKDSQQSSSTWSALPEPEAVIINPMSGLYRVIRVAT